MSTLCFVLAPGQNHFFVELVEALRDELTALGVATEVSTTGFPEPRDDLAYVLVPPHEYAALAPEALRPTPRLLARTVLLCAEQPGTKFFDGNLAIARAGAGAVLDINADAVRELRLLDVPAVHGPVGWTPRWTAEATSARDIDVLHLGVFTPRRAAALAGYGPALSRVRTELRLADPESTNEAGRPGYAVDDDKWGLLRRSRVLLNVHAEPRSYFESLRVVQAMCNGTAVVTEHSSGIAPFVPGTHLLSGRLETLAELALSLLDDEAARTALADEAERLLRSELPLRRTAELLAELGERVARAPLSAPADPVPRPYPVVPAGDDGRFPSQVADPEASAVRAALKELRLEVLQLGRGLRRAELGRERDGSVPLSEVVAVSAAYDASTPRISVLTALYNHAEHIGAALDSVAATGRRDVELVVCDDGSTDDGAAVVRAWIDARPEVPVKLVAHPVNRGLGPARNTALEHARGELSFVLDADNEVYPSVFDRLEGELAGADPDVAFAYPMMEMRGAGPADGLRSALAWDARLLRRGNFIDAMALWRTAMLREAGGYTTDRRLHGWEDYDLWCRIAEGGRRGMLVPQVLARYRVSGHSMLSLTDLSWRVAVSLLIERYPRVMAGVQAPL